MTTQRYTIELHETAKAGVYRSDDTEIMFMVLPGALNGSVDRSAMCIEFRGPENQGEEPFGPLTGELFGHPHAAGIHSPSDTPFTGHVVTLDTGDTVRLELINKGGDIAAEVHAVVGSLGTLRGRVAD